MKIKKLFKEIPNVQIKGSKEMEINGICSNSKLVAPGNLFIARKGMSDDGTRYIPEAISGGAVAVLSDMYDPSLSKEVTQIIHPNVSNVEGLLASYYYHFPSEELFMVGITGTNGKTTTSFIVRHLLNQLDAPSGLIGTIEYIIGKQRYQATRTTPDVLSNHKMLREMVLHGCQSAVMEVTSHALEQGRVDNIDFDVELQSETRGVLPEIGKFHPNGAPEWSKGTPFSLAMGYNLQCNSLQLLRAHAILVNGGYLVQPTLVRKIVKKAPDGTDIILLDNTHPDRLKQFPQVLPPDICELVSTTMKYSTKPGGTATRADIRGYTEAGKTSTSKKIVNGSYSETAYRSSFIGFTPAKNPAFIMVVTMDEPEYGYAAGIGRIHHGGVVSAPVFREIGRRALEYLGVAPDDPYGYPAGDPRSDPDKADWIPESRKLQERYDNWNGGGHAKK